ncbi:hypothetical protein N7492_008445 [Penicillium capsulatum]|uniref:Uncharacterized protein n=1 Tax=Penicillium capsulatum TaxID=69766 RepID=A0A9W9HRM0_9EURO|nr:hypothetical protein N7492_008445 [Penicillium capsulatum]KAJ6105847.1 hypothetical protein N7512_009364 [Penicillium capsulatum]
MARPWEYQGNESSRQRGRPRGSGWQSWRPGAQPPKNRPGSITKRDLYSDNDSGKRSWSASGDKFQLETIISILKTYQERLSALEDNLQARHQRLEKNTQDSQKSFEEIISRQDERIKSIVMAQDKRAEEALAIDTKRNEKLNNLGHLLENMSNAISQYAQPVTIPEVGGTPNDFDLFFENQLDQPGSLMN